MTSNMTMTAISICNFLKLIVKSTVEHYTEDFKLDIKIFKRYAKEAQETGKPVSMLWFCRSCGTYLCPEEDAYKKDTPMFITFKYYDEQEEEEARTIKAFLVTVTAFAVTQYLPKRSSLSMIKVPLSRTMATIRF